MSCQRAPISGIRPRQLRARNAAYSPISCGFRQKSDFPPATFPCLYPPNGWALGPAPQPWTPFDLLYERVGFPPALYVFWGVAAQPYICSMLPYPRPNALAYFTQFATVGASLRISISSLIPPRLSVVGLLPQRITIPLIIIDQLFYILHLFFIGHRIYVCIK